jgi:hypothetical protein
MGYKQRYNLPPLRGTTVIHGAGNAPPVVTQLSAPTGLAVTPMSGSNGASWNPVANAVGYRLQRALVTNGTTGSYSTVYENTGTSYSDTAVQPGSSYRYRVLAIGTGNYASSPYSASILVTAASTTTPTPTKLDYPANLRQTGNTTSSVTVAYDAVPNATGYRLLVNGGTTYMPGTALSYQITGLASGSTPNVQVQALYSGSGNYANSDYSPAVQVTVAANTGTDFMLAYTGDSILSEDYGTPSTPTLITQNYTGTASFKGVAGNWAHSGDTIRNQINAIKAAPPTINPNVDTFFYVEPAVNDCGFGSLGSNSDDSILAAMQSDLLELHNLLRSYGSRCYTIATTMIAAGILVGQNYDANVEAKRFRLIQKMNTWSRTNYRTVLGAECLVDRMSDRIFDQLSDTTNTTYYQDHVHPTQAGRNLVEGPLGIRGVDAARAHQHIIIIGDRDTSVNLDYVAPPAQPGVQIVEDSNIAFQKSGTWQFDTGNPNYTDGSAIFSTVIGNTLTLIDNCNKVEFFTADIATGGVIRMRITDPSGTEVYNQTFNHAAAGMTQATGSTPKLTANLPSVANYTIVFSVVGGGSNNVAALDYVRTSGGTGPVGNGSGAVSFEAENPGAWTDTGTWSISTAAVWSSGGQGAYTNDVGATRMLTRALTRVQLITLNENGPGVWRMRLTRVSDGVVVYDQQASVNRQPYQNVTDQSNPLLDTGSLALTTYKLELIVVGAPAAFDNVLITTS